MKEAGAARTPLSETYFAGKIGRRHSRPSHRQQPTLQLPQPPHRHPSGYSCYNREAVGSNRHVADNIPAVGDIPNCSNCSRYSGEY